MTFSVVSIKTAAGAAGIAAAAILTAATASADPDVLPFGRMAQMSGAGGSEVTDYTVKNLQPSGRNDGVWYSDVTVTAARGVVTPIIGDFNARAADGTTYTTIEGANPDGLTNQPIPPGGAAHGRIFFQVNNGPAPDSVVYNTGGNRDTVIWKS
ncbi:MAG TPA: DUF1942 domain-containing protein [Mycobacterium sp.]|nr:DUF1942 domain-containing protein [Mycobacterium sp.]